MSPEITATLFVPPHGIPHTLRLTAKVPLGKRDLLCKHGETRIFKNAGFDPNRKASWLVSFRNPSRRSVMSTMYCSRSAVSQLIVIQAILIGQRQFIDLRL